ncbi:MAG: UDP-N-acetylmuramate--L-alanine ligase [Spirochaeta sp. LUC14_002_19_P3]|nr:MAG: UDP-N-acetylmuramate--L-alanine ligase [Spirochaeta sp. LUC14_002_19_P3]
MSDTHTACNPLADVHNKRVHLIGAKGTGMCALAEMLTSSGVKVSGSDTNEVFYTDKILKELGIPITSFESTRLSPDTDLAVRSAAYDDNNPTVAAALAANIPLISYPQALGYLSRLYDAAAVAGVHGKTTTTALAGTLVKKLHLPAAVIVGSAVAGFGDRAVWREGGQFLIAETCEYRRHFLHYHPRRIVLTNVESDHQDYFPDYGAIKTAFEEFILLLPENGELIYCRDDAGARDTVESIREKRSDISFIPYGETANGPWAVEFLPPKPGINEFRVAAYDRVFQLHIPGRHIALNAAAALALIHSIWPGVDGAAAAKALASFRGSRRRCETIGEVNGALVLDDYAHHPTAIAATLKGIREFYPQRRIIADFMPHTYSRTAALLKEFAACFEHADILILHPIYASARELDSLGVSGEDLAQRAAAERGKRITVFHKDFSQTAEYLRTILCSDDLFITLGAGNNWNIGRELVGEGSR